jgi:RNA polymerase sigma factor (sigma-70 family)
MNEITETGNRVDKDINSDYEGDEIMNLVQRCSGGEVEALQEFFKRFSGDMYNFPIKVFHLDEDSASDFFLYAYERLKDGRRFRSFQGRSSFRTWFYTVLRNLLIDWMRTIRELQTVNFSQMDDNGNGPVRSIENTPDPRSIADSLDQPSLLAERLGKLGMDLRIIFKLSYIYYLDLDAQEIEYIAKKSGKSTASIIHYIAHLKHILSEKEIKNLSAEDKITSLYLSLLDLKTRRDRITESNRKAGENSTMNTDQMYELEKIKKAIDKKYSQRDRLLEKKERGHFIVRTPYKYIASILNIPEGSVSVQMMRVIEKMRSKTV